MKIKKGVRRVYSSRRIRANEDLEDEGAPAGGVTVDPSATELVFEAEDVAELVAEVTGEEVAVTVDDDAVTFSVGDEDFVVEPDGAEDEEILEASRKALRGKRRVAASTRRPAPARKPARKPAAKPIRRR